MAHCPSCGSEVSGTAMFCQSCGSPLSGYARRQQQVQNQQPRQHGPEPVHGGFVRSFGAGAGGCIGFVVAMMILFAGCMAIGQIGS